MSRILHRFYSNTQLERQGGFYVPIQPQTKARAWIWGVSCSVFVCPIHAVLSLASPDTPFLTLILHASQGGEQEICVRSRGKSGGDRTSAFGFLSPVL